MTATQTAISPELIAAYSATQYRVGAGAHAFTLRIDEHSPELARLYETSGQACAAFITAYNPRSEHRSEAVNRAAHERLCNELERHGIAMLEGAGVDPSTGWRETSVLAPGLTLERASRIGVAFDQNAIVWAGGDAVPKLILLR